MFQTKANSIESNEEIISNAESELVEAIPTDFSTFKNRNLLLRKKEQSISLGQIKTYQTNSEGRIAVYGDSNCLDSTHLEKACYWLLITFLDFAINSHKSSLLQNLNRITEFHKLKRAPLPLRISSSNFKSRSLTNICEHFHLLNSSKREPVKQRKSSILDVVTRESEGKYIYKRFPLNGFKYASFFSEYEINLINLLDAEITKLSQNNDYFTGSQVADSLRTPIIFMISLSLLVIILFVLFIKRRFIL